MPNFLNKTNKTKKAAKIKTTKRAPAKAVAGGESGSVNNGNNNNDNSSSNNNNITSISNGNSIDASNPIKMELSDVLTAPTTLPIHREERNDGCTANDANDDDQTDNNAAAPADKCTMPFVVTKSGSDMSTITVNNRVLPLNTSDDLERAAALLMHQTLDLEDSEFVNIKSELIDPIDAAGDDPQDFGRPHANALPLDFPNFHGPDFLCYSYYPQATQCDFAMMPLPPINTVKRKLKGINSSSTIFPGMTNVL